MSEFFRFISRSLPLLGAVFLLIAASPPECEESAGEEDASDRPMENPNAGAGVPTKPVTDGGGEESRELEIDCGKITLKIRDFRSSRTTSGHPDFESFVSLQPTPGMVAAELGADQKPVYAYDALMMKPNGEQLTSKAMFDQWYNDVAGVNDAKTLTWLISGSVFGGATYFPIDGELFGDTPPAALRAPQGGAHNYHFTTEAHGAFVYDAGQTQKLRFYSDDDLWVFVNGKLALDLGGVHYETAGEINLQTQAAALGLVSNERAKIDVFHAERHSSQSVLRLETENIACIGSLKPPAS